MRKLKLFKAIVATRSTRSESSTEGERKSKRERERERESFRERKKWEIGVSERSKPKGH